LADLKDHGRVIFACSAEVFLLSLNVGMKNRIANTTETGTNNMILFQEVGFSVFREQETGFCSGKLVFCEFRNKNGDYVPGGRDIEDYTWVRDKYRWFFPKV